MSEKNEIAMVLAIHKYRRHNAANNFKHGVSSLTLQEMYADYAQRVQPTIKQFQWAIWALMANFKRFCGTYIILFIADRISPYIMFTNSIVLKNSEVLRNVHNL